MDKEHTRKVIQSLTEAYLHNITPKPDVDVSLCDICGQMTDNWSSGWPKNKTILWRCQTCRQKRSRLEQKELEQILENMCDES